MRALFLCAMDFSEVDETVTWFKYINWINIMNAHVSSSGGGQALGWLYFGHTCFPCVPQVIVRLQSKP